MNAYASIPRLTAHILSHSCALAPVMFTWEYYATQISNWVVMSWAVVGNGWLVVEIHFSLMEMSICLIRWCNIKVNSLAEHEIPKYHISNIFSFKFNLNLNNFIIGLQYATLYIISLAHCILEYDFVNTCGITLLWYYCFDIRCCCLSVYGHVDCRHEVLLVNPPFSIYL